MPRPCAQIVPGVELRAGYHQEHQENYDGLMNLLHDPRSLLVSLATLSLASIPCSQKFNADVIAEHSKELFAFERKVVLYQFMESPLY